MHSSSLALLDTSLFHIISLSTHSLHSPLSLLPLLFSAAPKFTMKPTDLDLLYGTTATIACAFNGFPKPSVEWRMDRRTLTSESERIRMTSCATSSILEIIKLCYEDMGTYTCIITNSSGSNSAHMTLNVHGECSHVTVT